MTKILVLCCFTLMFSWLPNIALNAQTTVTGTVVDENEGYPIPGLSVAVTGKGSTSILAYSSTNDKGNYVVKFNTNLDSVIISVSGMSVKKQSVSYLVRNGVLNFKLLLGTIVLKEMKVKPPRIRRLNDTINYDVSQFMGNGDRTIGETLKRMPGIKVGDDGSISYNGKAINKFYIENQDLLEGRYGIATNNIESKDVATIQILENHQPIKALKDKEFSDQPALNLRLKESAKNVLISNAQIGIGMKPLLWNNEAFGMYLQKDRQLMGTYKGNNTGNDSAAELQDFYSTDNKVSFPMALGIQSSSAPGVSRKRYLLNKDNAISISSLRSLHKDLKLTANISYANDQQIRTGYSRTERFLPNGNTFTIEELTKAQEKFHYIDAAVKLNANKDNFYFDDALKISGDLSRTESGVVESVNLVDQKRSAPYFKVSNNFSLIRNYRKSTLRINSYNGSGNMKDELTVLPMLYSQLFSTADQSVGLIQSLGQNVFLTSNNISLGFNKNKFTQNYSIGANGNISNIDSDLGRLAEDQSLRPTTDSLQNDISWQRYEIYFSPEYGFFSKKFTISIKFPLTLVDQKIVNNVIKSQQRLDKFFFNPLVFINYKLNQLWSLTASANSFGSIEGVNNGLTGYILQSYRYLSRNDGPIPERRNLSLRLSADYRHPISQIFGYISGEYTASKSNLLFGNEFRDFLSIRRAVQMPNLTFRYSVAGDVGKSFESTLRKITFNAALTTSQNMLLNQFVVTKYLNNYFSAGIGLDTKFLEWADFSYGANFGYSETIIKDTFRTIDPILSGSQYGILNIFPAKNIVLKIKYENTINSAVSGDGKIMNFADANIKYLYKQLEFNIECNNIFNTRQYVIAAFDGLGSYLSTYNLRPTQVLFKVRFKIK